MPDDPQSIPAGQDSSNASPAIKQGKITFANGSQAAYIVASPNEAPDEVIRQLGLSQPQAVILIAGGAGSVSQGLQDKLLRLFSRGIARAALERQAYLIDGGTQAGVMKLMGLGLAHRRMGLPVKPISEPVLIGVAPYFKVTFPGDPDAEAKKGAEKEPPAPLDPNHTHFVLVDGDQWGCETQLMYRLARAFTEGPAAPGIPAKCKAVLVLAGGNPEGVARDETLQAVRNGWPVFVIDGSGRLADRVAGLKRKLSSRKRRIEQEWYRFLLRFLPIKPGPARIADPHQAEIVEDGKLIVFPLNHPADALARQIANELRTLPEDLLRLAWDRFALYDLNADRQQKIYKPLKNWPLILGIVSTFIVIVHQVVYPTDTGPMALTWPFGQPNPWLALLKDIWHLSIIAIPILIAGVLAAERRIKPSSKWIYLRDAAETIKRAIYNRRLFMKLSQDEPSWLAKDQTELSKSLKRLKNRIPMTEAELVDLLERVNTRLMQSDVKESALVPYSGALPPVIYGAAGKDDGFTPLTPDQYIGILVNDQIGYYRPKTNQLESQLMFYQILIWVFGGLGSLLAAFGQQIWLPLTTSFVTAFTAWLDYQQVQETLVKFNHSETRLSNIKNWWKSLGTEEQKDPQNIIRLVDQVEDTLADEVRGWVQHMQEAKAGEEEGQTKGQTPKPRRKVSKTEPGDAGNH